MLEIAQLGRLALLGIINVDTWTSSPSTEGELKSRPRFLSCLGSAPRNGGYASGHVVNFRVVGKSFYTEL